MKSKLKYVILCLVLCVFWLLPLLYGGLSFDAEYVRSLAAGLLCAAAALCSRLPRNRHAAIGSVAVIGAVACVLQPSQAFVFLPALLLCCWLRCYTEAGKGNAVRLYLELFTDLIYAYIIGTAVRLIRSGYAFLQINKTDTQTLPDLCLMAIVFLLFCVCFVVGWPYKGRQTNRKQAKAKRADGTVVGLIPVVVSLRTFWGFCALLFVAVFLQIINVKLVAEMILFQRAGLRLTLLPWMVLLFLVLDAFLPDTAFGKRLRGE